MPKLRLASALLIPPPEATEIDGLRRACGDGMLGRVDAHVTLVEPINVREESLDEVEQIMRDAAAATPGPLTLTFGPALSFHPESPVLYLAVDGDLDELAALRTAMRVGPFAREAAWPFVPHVTIGTDLSEERLDAGVAALAEFSTTVSLTHVHVLQEQRDPDEVRRWRPIADAALGGRTVSGRGGIELEVTEGCRLGLDLDGPSPRDRRRRSTGLDDRWRGSALVAFGRRDRARHRHRAQAARRRRGHRSKVGRDAARRLDRGVASELLARPRVARRG